MVHMVILHAANTMLIGASLQSRDGGRGRLTNLPTTLPKIFTGSRHYLSFHRTSTNNTARRPMAWARQDGGNHHPGKIEGWERMD
jgi:hypothetical protein